VYAFVGYIVTAEARKASRKSGILQDH